MAYDKVVDSSVLDAGLKAIADAIRAKGGTSGNLAFPTAMAEAIAAIEAGGGGGLCTTGTLTIAEDATTVYIPHTALAYEGSVYPKVAFICPVIRETRDDITFNFGGCVIARFEDNTPLLTSSYKNLPGDYFQYGRLNGKHKTPLYSSSTRVSYKSGMSANSFNFTGTNWSAGTEFFYGCIW